MLDVTESWRAGAIVGKWTEAGILLPDSLRCNSQRPAHPSHITNECLSGRLRSCGTSPCWLTVELFPFLARFLLPPYSFRLLVTFSSSFFWPDTWHCRSTSCHSRLASSASLIEWDRAVCRSCLSSLAVFSGHHPFCVECCPTVWLYLIVLSAAGDCRCFRC